MNETLENKSTETVKAMLKRFCIVVIFGIAFAYIEAAVVVYLRTIFHPSGFTFPLAEFGISEQWKQLLSTEVGREFATMILILTGAWLIGRNLRERFAYFMTIFAVWDIFYYIWLKVLINWPGSITDWDILFLIPAAWAGPVFAPMLVSAGLAIFAVTILYRHAHSRDIKAGWIDWLGFILAGAIVVSSFCISGLHISQRDFDCYFYWPIFASGYILAAAVFVKCLLQSG